MELYLMSFTPEEWGKQSGANLLILHFCVIAIIVALVLLIFTDRGRRVIGWCLFRLLDVAEWCALHSYRAWKWVRNKLQPSK